MDPVDRSARRTGRPRRRVRAFWLKQLHQWHWVSSALCLAAMLLFAATGITLNHAGEIGGKAVVTTIEDRLPDPLPGSHAGLPQGGRHPLPPAMQSWLADRLHLQLQGRLAEWSPGTVYLALPEPGGDAWLEVDLATGALLYERTDHGWIAYLNDLHKGRNTGGVWRWFIDIFAAACLVFCLTGLLLLYLHAGHRPATWPMVGLGLAVPLGLALLFMH